MGAAATPLGLGPGHYVWGAAGMDRASTAGVFGGTKRSYQVALTVGGGRCFPPPCLSPICWAPSGQHRGPTGPRWDPDRSAGVWPRGLMQPVWPIAAEAGPALGFCFFFWPDFTRCHPVTWPAGSLVQARLPGGVFAILTLDLLVSSANPPGQNQTLRPSLAAASPCPAPPVAALEAPVWSASYFLSGSPTLW